MLDNRYKFIKFKKFITQYIELNEYQWRILKKYLKVRSYKKGDVLGSTDKIFDSLFFLNHGIVIGRQKYFNNIWYMFYADINSNRIKNENKTIVDFYSYIHRTNSNIKFEVYQDSEAIVLEYKDLIKFCKQYHPKKSFIELLSTIEAKRVEKQVNELLYKDFQERLKRFKKQNRYLMNNMDIESIENYLGVDRRLENLIKNKYIK